MIVTTTKNEGDLYELPPFAVEEHSCLRKFYNINIKDTIKKTFGIVGGERWAL